MLSRSRSRCCLDLDETRSRSRSRLSYLDDLHILLWISRCTSRSSLDLYLDLYVI